MKPLTLEFAKENKFTPLDLVRYFEPDAPEEKCDYILWEQTCFPFSIEQTIAQLNNLYLNKR